MGVCGNPNEMTHDPGPFSKPLTIFVKSQNGISTNAENYGDVNRSMVDIQDLGTSGTYGSNINPNFDFPINTNEYELSNMYVL